MKEELITLTVVPNIYIYTYTSSACRAECHRQGGCKILSDELTAGFGLLMEFVDSSKT